MTNQRLSLTNWQMVARSTVLERKLTIDRVVTETAAHYVQPVGMPHGNQVANQSRRSLQLASLQQPLKFDIIYTY